MPRLTAAVGFPGRSLSRLRVQRRPVGVPGLSVAGALLAALLAGVAPAWAGRLEGMAVLTQPFPLPADAVLDVQLLEVTRADAPAILRGRSRIPSLGRPPFPWVVPYLDGAIQPGQRYGLRATIHQADRLLFTTDTANPVLEGRSAPMLLQLVPVGTAPLRGLLWLRAPAASVPVPLQAPRQEQQFRLDPLTRELTGSGDCNRFVGLFELEGESLRLNPAATTMLDCEPAVIADERRFLEDLQRVRRWRLDRDGRLELLDAGGQPVLLMETRPL